MGEINPSRAGFIFAALIGVWHLMWVVLVATGLAQPFMNFIFSIHFIKPVYVIEGFAAGRAVLLILVTSAIGYGTGCAFGLLWNRLRK